MVDAAEPWARSAVRQQIVAWRDEHRLMVAAWIDGAARGALAAVDRAVPEAGWRAALVDRDAFARRLVDRAMILEMRTCFPALADAAARDLAGIAPPLALLAGELPALLRPVLPDVAADPPAPKAATNTAAAAPTTRRPVVERSLAMAGLARDRLGDALAAGGEHIRDWTGLHERLRAAARARLAAGWTGEGSEGGEPRPILAQIDCTLVEVADRAMDRAMGSGG